MLQRVHELANSQPAPTSGVQIVRKILHIFFVVKKKLVLVTSL